MSGRRGPVSQPPELEALHGNPSRGKGGQPRRPMQSLPGNMAPPKKLRGAARREWRRVLKTLPEGFLTPADRELLLRYCQLHAQLNELQATIEKEGVTFTTPKGYIAQRPEIGILNRLRELMKKYCVELGLSPTARQRVHLPEALPAGDTPAPSREEQDERGIFGPRRVS